MRNAVKYFPCHMNSRIAESNKKTRFSRGRKYILLEILSTAIFGSSIANGNALKKYFLINTTHVTKQQTKNRGKNISVIRLNWITRVFFPVKQQKNIVEIKRKSGGK